MSFIIDRLFKSNEIHIISGPASSGKTSLLLHIASLWSKGEPFLDCSSHTASCCIVSCHKSLSCLEESISRISPELLSLPHLSMTDCWQNHLAPSFSTLITAVFARVNAKVLWIDGLPDLCEGNPTISRDVSKFLTEILQVCKHRKLTIVCTVFSSKTYSPDSSLLDRVLGSTAWVTHTSTKLLIEPQSKKFSDPYRKIHLLPNNLPARETNWKFSDSGELIFLSEGDQPPLEQSCVLDSWLIEQEPGSTWTTGQILMVAASAAPPVPRRSTERWISDQVSLGGLSKVARGEYCVSGGVTKT